MYYTLNKNITKVIERLVEAANILENNARGNIFDTELETVYSVTSNIFDTKFEVMEMFHDLRYEFEEVSPIKFICYFRRHDSILMSDQAIDLIDDCIRAAVGQGYRVVTMFELNRWFGQETTYEDHFNYLVLEDCPDLTEY